MRCLQVPDALGVLADGAVGGEEAAFRGVHQRQTGALALIRDA